MYIKIDKHNAASVIKDEQLSAWLKDGSIEDGDMVYRVSDVLVAVEKKEMRLVNPETEVVDAKEAV